MYDTMALPFVLKSGSSVSLKSQLDKIYGSDVSLITYLSLNQYSKATAQDYDFTYWKGGNHQVNTWTVGGKGIAYDSAWPSVDVSKLDTVKLTAGNIIWGNTSLYFGTPTYSYEQLVANVVDPAVARAGMTDGIVDAFDIVAAAKRMAKYYGPVPNDNDCHNIASTVAAAAGAVLSPLTSEYQNPKLNVEYGFWRVAYRGTDKNATSDWSEIIKPGDIVRMAWSNGGGPHTATIVAVHSNGTFDVYDNYNHTIAIRTVSYDNLTKKGSITVYRLTGDHLFLINGTDANDEIVGTLFSDKLVGGKGNDILHGGLKNDVLIGGAGADKLIGGSGIDTASYEGASKAVMASLARPSSNTNDAKGDTYSSIERLTGSGFSDYLYGNNGGNRITGGAGNDTIFGGLGKDLLIGGTGKDTFVFNTKLGATNIDVIDDFSVKDDRIVLDDDIFIKAGKVGDLSTAAFYAGTKAHDTTDRVIYDKTTGKLWYDADGTGATKAIQVATLDTGLKMTAADFDIIA